MWEIEMWARRTYSEVGEELILALEDAPYRRPGQTLVGSVDGC